MMMLLHTVANDQMTCKLEYVCLNFRAKFELAGFLNPDNLNFRAKSKMKVHWVKKIFF